MTTTATLHTWSSTMRLVVEDDRVLAEASADLAALLDRVDRAASRFRADSALSQANAHAGRPVPVPRLLVSLVDAALRAAGRTEGLVDPTVGTALLATGYDRDIADVPVDGDAVRTAPAVRDWRSVRLDRQAGLLTVPAGTVLDLGATAKAWTADHAATRLHRRFGSAVLVELGGDIAVAGGYDWRVRVAEREGGDGQAITVHRGGVATSTTTIRRWQRGGRELHHVIDPRTGTSADGPWRTVTVAADSALEANTASTAAIVLGTDALSWLTDRGFAARLVHHDGDVHMTAGWPADLALAVSA